MLGYLSACPSRTISRVFPSLIVMFPSSTTMLYALTDQCRGLSKSIFEAAPLSLIGALTGFMRRVIAMQGNYMNQNHRKVWLYIGDYICGDDWKLLRIHA